MFQPDVLDKRVWFRSIGKLASWMENTPEVAISLPASIMDNDSLVELETTTEVLIITTEHFEGHLIKDRECTAHRTAIDDSLMIDEYRVLCNP